MSVNEPYIKYINGLKELVLFPDMRTWTLFLVTLTLVLVCMILYFQSQPQFPLKPIQRMFSTQYMEQDETVYNPNPKVVGAYFPHPKRVQFEVEVRPAKPRNTMKLPPLPENHSNTKEYSHAQYVKEIAQPKYADESTLRDNETVKLKTWNKPTESNAGTVQPTVTDIIPTSSPSSSEDGSLVKGVDVELTTAAKETSTTTAEMSLAEDENKEASVKLDIQRNFKENVAIQTNTDGDMHDDKTATQPNANNKQQPITKLEPNIPSNVIGNGEPKSNYKQQVITQLEPNIQRNVIGNAKPNKNDKQQAIAKVGEPNSQSNIISNGENIQDMVQIEKNALGNNPGVVEKQQNIDQNNTNKLQLRKPDIELNSQQNALANPGTEPNVKHIIQANLQAQPNIQGNVPANPMMDSNVKESASLVNEPNIQDSIQLNVAMSQDAETPNSQNVQNNGPVNPQAEAHAKYNVPFQENAQQFPEMKQKMQKNVAEQNIPLETIKNAQDSNDQHIKGNEMKDARVDDNTPLDVKNEPDNSSKSIDDALHQNLVSDVELTLENNVLQQNVPAEKQENEEIEEHITTVESLEEKFQAILKATANKEGLIFLSSVDSAYLSLAINLYKTSFLKLNIVNYLFVCSDEKAYKALEEKQINSFKYIEDADSDKPVIYGTKEFRRKTHLKTKMILDAVTIGLTIIVVDVDIVFFKDPLPYLNCLDCDIQIQSDVSEGNSGFYMARPTTPAISLHQQAWDKALTEGEIFSNQKLLDRTMEAMQRMGKIKTKTLDKNLFPSGFVYFEEKKRMFYTDNPPSQEVILHNNWIVSMEAKIYRFKELLLWQVDSGYYSNPDRKYLIYDNPQDFGFTNTQKQETDALISALLIGNLLRRVVILPTFTCHNCKYGACKVPSRKCAFNTHYKISSFDKVLGESYREHVFLDNSLVPDTVKTQSNFYFIRHTQSAEITGVNILTPANVEAGPTAMEIVEWFVDKSEPVLRFHSMYNILTTLRIDLKEDYDKIMKAIDEKTDYRQY